MLYSRQIDLLEEEIDQMLCQEDIFVEIHGPVDGYELKSQEIRGQE